MPNISQDDAARTWEAIRQLQAEHENLVHETKTAIESLDDRIQNIWIALGRIDAEITDLQGE